MQMMKRDRNWECYQSLNPRRFAGRYVVIAGGTLIGAGKQLGRLLRMAQRSNPRDIPFVARVRDPRKICVYRGRQDA